MNRPFMAFGALMTFLTMAMFAVSSSSRSTTVQNRAVNHRRVAGVKDAGELCQTQVTLVEQSPSELLDKVDEAVDSPVIKEESYVEAPCSTELSREHSTTPRLEAVRIQVAENTADVGLKDAFRWSNYGFVYEWVFFGAKRNSVVTSDFGATEVPVSADDQLLLFRSLLDRAPAQSLEPDPRSNSAAKPSIGWPEYADFMADLPRPTAVNADVAGGSDALASVQSSDWLRHSAASSLSRMSHMLQAAAVMLETAASPSFQ